MIKKISKAISFSIVILLLTSCKSSAELTSSKAITLFNGKDLSGWTIHGTEKWYVEEGVLIAENGIDEAFGYLKTDKNYKNFELIAEFKLSEKGNSGVFIHSTIDENVKIEGWQIEIAPPGHKLGGIHKYDSGWLNQPDPEKDQFFNEGTWNTMKVVVNNNNITTWLNNHQMATYTDEKIGNTTGGIAFQIHKGKVAKIAWRNIKLIKL